METTANLARRRRAAARRMAVALWCCLLGWFGQLAQAQAVRPLFLSHLKMADGLSHDDALDILQDRQGFVWVATESGLNRFDGRQVRVYRRGMSGSEGLDADFINALAEDADGNLWLATLGGGLVKWERRRDAFVSFRHDGNRADSLGSDAVLDVWVAPDGMVWAGTEAGGLDRLDPRTGKITRFRGAEGTNELPQSPVYVLAPSRDGLVWVGTDAGIALFDAAKGRVLRRYGSAGPVALTNSKIRALYPEADGTVWIGTLGGGLMRLSADGSRIKSFRPDPASPGALSGEIVRAILRDSGGRLWVGTSKGLDLMRGEEVFHHYAYRPDNPRGLADSNIMSLYQDRSGLLWVGTRSGGVSRWNPRSWQLGHYRPVMASGLPITAFAPGDTPGEMLVATLGAGVLSVDFRTGLERNWLARAQGLTSDRVMALLRDRQERVWMATFDGGLARRDGRGALKVFRAGDGSGFPVDGVMSLYQGASGTVWAGTFGGGACRYLETGRFDCFTAEAPAGQRLSDPRATAMVEDAAGRLWIGTPGGGLNLLDPRTREVRVFRRAGRDVERAGLSDDRIYALHLDPAGVLWVGTAAGGLMRIVPPAADDTMRPLQIRTYGAADGLPSAVVYGIQPGDGDELWLSTANGLVRFSRSKGLLDHYTEAQGLQGADFNFGAHARLPDGTLAFGGTGGLNRFRPAEIERGQGAPPLVLTAFEILNKPADVRLPAFLLDRAELGYRDAVVSFEFAALDFVAPEDNRYEYRLEGFDEEWVDAGTRNRVSYTNLAAGDYVFRVRARNADGVPSAKDLSVPIKVHPAPWRSPLAYACYALVGLAIVGYAVLAFRRKRRREIEYNRRLEQTVHERTRELEERNEMLQALTAARSAFVARMSHELRTPMNGVIGIADLLLDTSLDDTQRRFTRSIQQSAQSLVQIVNNILDFSKMEVAEIRLDPVPTAVDVVVEQAVELFAGRAAEKGLELVCASPATPLPEVMIDVVRFRQVALNLIGNAVKFTDAGSVRVSLTAGLSGNDGLVHLVLRVADTGIGIRNENLGHIFNAFQQEDNSTTRRFGGSGLGLTIARQLAELMGGRLAVSSVHGEGSVFTLTLSVPAASRDGTEQVQTQTPTGLREVLVVDASPAVREVLLQWLGNWGIRARAAESWAGFPAERLQQAGPEDVILASDAGWIAARGTVVETWKDWPAEQQPRCVLLSGFARRAGAPVTGLNPSMFHAHLVKPLRWRELLQVLTRLAEGSPHPPLPFQDETTPVTARTLDVLVVDDHALNRTIAVGKLAALGHRAVAVTGGLEALETLARQHFDLVLMDCQMPDMDGYQASAEIRRRESGTGRRTPIIALTADATTESRERCTLAGMDDFIEKPFARETLAEKLAEWCSASVAP